MLILVFAANLRPQPQLGVFCRTSRSGCRDMFNLQWSGNSFKYRRVGGSDSEKLFDERWSADASFLVCFWNKVFNNLQNSDRFEAEDSSPVLWLLLQKLTPNVTAAINGVERGVCNREYMVRLYTGDVITVKKEAQEPQGPILYIEYVCEFFICFDAGRRCKPVEFETLLRSIITI